MIKHATFWSEDHERRDQLEYLCVDGRIILKRILWKCVVRIWTGLMWLRVGIGGGLI
jgi:hypothetical protein